MSATTPEHVELPITGMTCASCANRIERKLNKLDGVTATVNYATEKARVEFDPDTVAREQLVGAVEAAGYSATLPSSEPAGADAEAEPDDAAPLRRRLVISALLSVPALLLAMLPALQFDNFQWLSLQLVTPVVLWGAWPFHKAAWANLKHGAATMDTLVSLGTLAAWLWSLYALFIGDAGMNGHAHGVRRHPRRRRGRRRDLPRDGGHRDDVPARRPLLRGQGQAPRRRGAEGAAGAGVQGRRHPRRRRHRAARSGRAAAGRRPLRGRPGEKVASDGIVTEGVVPDSMPAVQLLESFRSSHKHTALVMDEYGAVEGLVTVTDLLTAIVGELPADASEAVGAFVSRADGSWLVDGSAAMEQVTTHFGMDNLPEEEAGAYHTIGGFVMARLGRVPKTADAFEWGGMKFEVIDMDGRRIDKVLVMRKPTAQARA